jgi:hypothetical protein
MYKVLWSHHTEEEAMWETEHYLNTHYPGFLQVHNRKCLSPTFVLNFRSQDEVLIKGVGCNIPDVYCAYDIT